MPHACVQWIALIGHSESQNQVSTVGWKAQVLKGPNGSCMEENKGIIRYFAFTYAIFQTINF